MNKKALGYMYILKCADDSYYTGSTIDLTRRLNEHKFGVGANYTSTRLPVELVYVEVYTDIYKAFRRERQIHGWSRAKKEALINNKRRALPRLAKRKKKLCD
ncbi:MAG: GIY-YIG nuclease family protein [Arcticibacter sp.]